MNSFKGYTLTKMFLKILAFLNIINRFSSRAKKMHYFSEQLGDKWDARSNIMRTDRSVSEQESKLRCGTRVDV